MASFRQKMILIALIVAIAIPISTSHKHKKRRSRDSDDTENYLRDLCSETKQSDACWNILKSNLNYCSNDRDDIANKVFDLAIAKTKDIRNNLNRWFSDSNDDKLKEKYRSCSKIYDKVQETLKKAKKNLDSDDHRKISDKIDGAFNDLKKCKRKFDSNDFDPGHVGDRNNELGLYLDIVRAAANRLEYYDHHDHE